MKAIISPHITINAVVMCLKATVLHRQWSQDETLLISFSNEKLNVQQPLIAQSAATLYGDPQENVGRY